MSQRPDDSSPEDSQSDETNHPEAVVSQALRAMAGGGKAAGRTEPTRIPGESGLSIGPRSDPRDESADGPWTTTNIVLAAVVVGLVVGIAAALTVLVLQ